MNLYGFENINLPIKRGFLDINGIPGAAGATGFSPISAPAEPPPTTAAAEPAGGGSGDSGGDGNGAMWGFGALALASSAGNSLMNNEMMTSLAKINTGLWETVNASNNETQKRLAEISTGAETDQTRWQVMGMIFNANTQYLQSVDYKRYMDQASRRAFFNERKQITGESKVMTLAHNAEIHVSRLEHDREMTKMEYNFQERIAASTSTATG